MNAIEIITAWNSKTPEQQYSFCDNCVKRAIRAGRTLKAGYDYDDAVQSTFEKVLERLAKVIANARNAKGITQEILSGLSDIGRTHLSAIERGERKPTLETLWRIALALDMRPSELVAKIEERIQE